MAIKFLCSNPECRTKLEVGDQLAGKKARCPKCKTVNVAPHRGDELPACPSPGSGIAGLETVLDQKRGRIDPFDAERELAHGGMGAVFVARDKALQREVAVKVIRPQIADSEEHRVRFLDEAQITAQLEHPNIVPVHELGKNAQGDLYVTMKLVKGKSLGELLKELKSVGVRENGSMGEKRPDKTARAQTPTRPHSHTPTLPDLLGVFLKVCDGIAFAHSKGVIHRDLKPDNIMVGEFGEVQIMDWGLAKVVGASCQLAASGEQVSGVRCQASDEEGDEQPGASGLKPETELRKADTVPAGGPQSAIRNQESVRSVRSGSDIALTVDGQITGTPAYMPPEQAEGKLELIDHRSDVYSLGAILYEILTLERPIEGDTVHKVLLNVSDGNITPPEQRAPGRHIPKELSAVVMKAMAKNRRKRYQSVQDLSQDIKRFLEGRAVSAKADTVAETVVKLVKRNRGASIATGIAAAVMVFGVIVGVVKIAAERNEAIRQKLIAEGKEREATDARDAQRSTALKASRRAAEQAARAAAEGRLDEAGIRADAAEEVAPWGPWGLFAKGAIAWERRELEKAEEHLRAARERAKEEPTIRNLLVRVQAATGKAKEAASLLENLDKIEKWEDLLAAGDVLYGVEDYRRAQSLYEAAVEKMKADPTVTPQRLEEAEDKLGNATAWVKCEGFYESIKDLPAKEQYARIAAKLEEIHGESVALAPVIVDGILREARLDRNARYLQPLEGLPLRELSCHASRVSDLTPLRGMPLTRLDCLGTGVNDLSSLEGMPLTHLNCQATGVSDLSPLEGMPLTTLNCPSTQVSDLSSLQGMPLNYLDCSGTQVSDLSPLGGMPLAMLGLNYCGQVEALSSLEGMPLKSLHLRSTRVSDLGPLKGMPLTTLDCLGTKVIDLTPLEGMPLTYLDLSGCTHVSDLSPLKGMPLKVLNCQSTAVSDLSPLEGIPLEAINFTLKNISKGIEVLRQMRSLQRINGLKPDEFWKKYDAGEFR